MTQREASTSQVFYSQVFVKNLRAIRRIDRSIGEPSCSRRCRRTDARKTKENRLAGPQPPAVTGSSLPGPLHDPSHRRARQGVARARARRYPQLTPVRPAADAVPQEADAALRRPDADLDEAPVERRHVGVEGSRQPLGEKKPRACGQPRAVPGYLFRGPNDVRSGGKWRPGTTPARPGGRRAGAGRVSFVTGAER